MKRQKIYEFPIDHSLTSANREAVEKYIAQNAHLSDKPVSYSWGEGEGDVLHISADPALIEVVFEDRRVDVYFSAPSWAQLFFTKTKKAQIQEQIETALREAEFSGANDKVPAKPDDIGSHFIQTGSEVKPMTTNVKDATETNPLSILGEALESAAESIGEATTDARASAKVAARKVQKSVGAGAYYTAYGLSYGIVFSAVFLTELLPESNALRRGFEDGAVAALDAAANRKVAALSDETDENALAAADDEPVLAHR